jgi:hypothetical protein
MGTSGRPLDWELPQTNPKEKKNLIWCEANGKGVTPAAHDGACYEFLLPSEVKAGDPLTICIGAPDRDEKKGNSAQKTSQRKRPFILSIDPKGKTDYKETEVFQIDVRGAELSNLKIFVPSLVAKNKRFDVMVRFEDEFGNLTSMAPEGTLIDLSYENFRESLNWKLFVPETGFIMLPNLYFNEAGIYRLQLKNLLTKETFFSSPIKCVAEAPYEINWGLLHGEWERYDSGPEIEVLLRYMRDEQMFQFFATSPFESEEETSADLWKTISNQIAEFHEDERFVSLLGFQYLGTPGEEGMRQFLYAKEGKPLMRKREAKFNSLKKIYKSHSPKDLIAIPTFTMGKSTCFNFQDFAPEYERVVEIYNAWGSSESKGDNLRPIIGPKEGIAESAEGSIQKALARGCKFGFVAGGYDDRGPYAPLFDTSQEQYSAGLTAILAADQTRAGLFEALYNRSCYATTGERIVLGLFVAASPMGSSLDTKTKPGLEYNRHITGYCLGTADLASVELIRNGEVLKQLPFKGHECEFTFDDSELLGSICLEPDGVPPFTYYYLRVVQSDGHIAWSSPIWIDLTSTTAAPIAKRGRKKSV